MRAPYVRLVMIFIIAIMITTLPIFAVSAEDYYAAAQKAYQQGNYNEAISNIDNAIKLDSTKVDYYLVRAQIKINLKNFTEAIVDDLNKVIELNPKNPKIVEIYNNRGYAKYHLKDYTGAITDYNKAIELDPKYALAYFNRGLVKTKTHDYTGAVSDYSKIIAMNPKNPVAYHDRGVVKYLVGDYTGAITDFDKAIELDPKYALAYNFRGESKEKLGNFAGAADDYTIAAKLDPDNQYIKDNFKRVHKIKIF